MYRNFIFMAIVAAVLWSCQDNNKPLSEVEKMIMDSLSKVSQRRKVDSLKQINPLLILPPDSEYTGDYIDKYPDGIVKFRGFFRFGQRHGQWISFYGTGMPWSEQHYDKGIKSGPNLVYYENGKLRYSGFYKKDKRDSSWIFYDSSGKVLKTIIYKDDKEQVVQES